MFYSESIITMMSVYPSDKDKSGKINDDDAILLQMGYEKKLHRGLGAFANFAFGFTEVAVLASFTTLWGYGLSTGGLCLDVCFLTSNLIFICGCC